MTTTTATPAVAKLEAFLSRASNAHLAMSLELAITGTTPEARELLGIAHYITTEARKRVGEQANAAADIEQAAFNARHGITEGMSDAELDAIFDNLTDEQFSETHGEWFHLVQALRA